MENPGFLKQKYNMHNAPEVKHAVKREEKLSGEKVSQDPEAQIQIYLDRLEKLALDSEKKQQKTTMFGGEQRPRALSLLREMVMNKYVRPNKEKMAEGAARVEERAAREMGMDVHYGEEELEQRGEIAVEDLEKSLDNWIKYLSDTNEPYPTWFRYYAFRSILDLGDYDKDKGEFTKRSSGSTRLFPDIDRGALGYVRDRIEAAKDPEMLERLKKAQKAAALENIPENQLITKAKAEQFAKLSFAKQYAEGIRQAGEITPEMREITEGKWIKYQKGTDPTALWASLQNKGTAWCTKGFGTAETQLQGGDFYVYYTLDKQGKPTIPRIAIRMQEDSIGEIRGVADNDQNFEGNLAEILDKKLDEPELKEKARVWKEKNADIKRLKVIAEKTETDQQLTRDELIFLYEINAPVKHFGYGDRHPEVAKIRNTRNPEEDMPIIFECESSQIATGLSGINEDTKAYIGEWSVGVFQKSRKHPNITHFYESFPDKKIFMQALETDPNINSPEKAKEELLAKGIYVSELDMKFLYRTEFSQNKKTYNLVRFTVEQMGFPKDANPETDEIYRKAKSLGLALCPAEVGPHLILQYSGEKERVAVAMEPIGSSVFEIIGVGGGSILTSHLAGPYERHWYYGSALIFCFHDYTLPAGVSEA